MHTATSRRDTSRITAAALNPKVATIAIVVAFAAAACGQPVAPAQPRALVPADAITPYYVGSPLDPAAVDELLAQAERSATAGELVVTADVSGCALPTIWAQPRPEQIAVSYEFDDTIACAEQVSYRAIFVIPGSGMNEHGRWAYSPGPPEIATEARRPHG